MLAPKWILYKNVIRKSLQPIEKAILGKYYFSLQNYLGFTHKLRLLVKYVFWRVVPYTTAHKPEIIFVLYSKACERMLMPLLLHLLAHPTVTRGQCNVRLIVIRGVHQLALSAASMGQLATHGCPIETDYFSLIRACHQPRHKVAVLCLDHRLLYDFHKCGVDTADTLKKSGVKTISIQHGGTRADCVQGLASAASETILVWGKRVARELIQTHGVAANRVRVVGNPLHDHLRSINQHDVLTTLSHYYPQAAPQLPRKNIVLLATCLHTEYKDYGNEQSLYIDYINHIYKSIDFFNVLLLIKMHPLDSRSPNLYHEAIKKVPYNSSIIIIESEVSALDVYKLLSIADILITRSSTVAEEALLMRKKVIAFDLWPHGPSRWYKHLEAYGNYTTRYAEPQDALAQAIATALSPHKAPRTGHKDIEEDITARLDGLSTQRAVDEIVSQLSQSSPTP